MPNVNTATFEYILCSISTGNLILTEYLVFNDIGNLDIAISSKHLRVQFLNEALKFFFFGKNGTEYWPYGDDWIKYIYFKNL